MCAGLVKRHLRVGLVYLRACRFLFERDYGGGVVWFRYLRADPRLGVAFETRVPTFESLNADLRSWFWSCHSDADGRRRVPRLMSLGDRE